METDEGTIRFGFELRPGSESDRIPSALAATAEGWCAILRHLDLLGRDPERYGGYAFGNVSMRDPSAPARFFITASQTTDKPCAAPAAWSRIDHYDFEHFAVAATGRSPPSSETLTHAAIYSAEPAFHWIYHVHSPRIWRAAHRLGLATVGADVPYGSSALAAAVARLADAQSSRPLVFATLGHEDGVFSCGPDADTTAGALIAALARAGRRG